MITFDTCIYHNAFDRQRSFKDDFVERDGRQIVVKEKAAGCITQGYFKDAETTRKTMRDGVFYTGDIGSFDEQLRLYFHGRMTDSIRHRGENVSAWEIEHVAGTHDDIDDCAAIGVDTEIGEQDIKLFVQPRAGATIDPVSFYDWLAPRLAAFQRPRYIALIDVFTTLLLTVDTPVHGKRDHDVHNNFRLPLPFTFRLLADLLRHPVWALRTAWSGTPQLVNLAKALGEHPDLAQNAATLARQMDRALSWKDIDWIKKHWNGRILIKGVLRSADACLAKRHGADGVVLSNHGGRQLDGTLSPVELVREVRERTGAAFDVFVDGGVRRGSDVVKAFGLGASGVLLGRAPLYGLAARGATGVAHVLALLKDEMSTAMTLLGCADVSAIAETVIDSLATSTARSEREYERGTDERC
ncbi:alpha-hydroxy-acid oxidizing protein [Paraburkholderia sp. MM5482-R1]|uniref:alpha-hydroxy acid oxidase n=1 Tax=unclassified Paraburkholderia TaxID=2615204 RepID=UPI003D241B8D